ncbi:uncharacterized protein LOC118292855 [Scophthalmus maximus]|uniref:uncharacterized protein LOC118292855 n=1 Tax=Scophthalmus maximus TaxID=52904 RepID=UPI001FA838F2|nr:uncharacterized protein LOC118292855 [Scophthalmus maximus]
MKKRTQQNYLKSLKRFSVFLTVQTNLRNEDLPLHKECQYFIAFNDSLQHILAKHSKKEITQKRRKCDSHSIIGVKEHKTAAQQVAVFTLSEEKEHWLDVYYRLVRPQLLRPTRKRKRDVEDEMDGEERFFLSTAGRQIHSASKDLHRLHTRHNLPSVTSQMARRVFETAAKSLTDSEKSMVADYLTHSSATAEKHYRVKTSGHAVTAAEIMKDMGGVSSSDSSGEDAIPEPSGEGTSFESSGESTSRSTCSTAGSATAVRSSSESEKEIQASFQILLTKYPVTIDGPKPKRELLKGVSCWRKFYERWEKRQLKLRQECVH